MRVISFIDEENTWSNSYVVLMTIIEYFMDSAYEEGKHQNFLDRVLKANSKKRLTKVLRRICTVKQLLLTIRKRQLQILGHIIKE